MRKPQSDQWIITPKIAIWGAASLTSIQKYLRRCSRITTQRPVVSSIIKPLGPACEARVAAIMSGLRLQLCLGLGPEFELDLER
jgi:hypothetical protein